jgi:hypothetical protein
MRMKEHCQLEEQLTLGGATSNATPPVTEKPVGALPHQPEAHMEDDAIAPGIVEPPTDVL